MNIKKLALTLAAASLVIAPVYAADQYEQERNSFENTYRYQKDGPSEDALQTQERVQTREQLREEKHLKDEQNEGKKKQVQERVREMTEERTGGSDRGNIDRANRSFGQSQGGKGGRH